MDLIMAHNLTHSQSIDSCLISGDPVVKILDLGQHAYADTFIKPEQLNLSEPVFPLEVWMNAESGSIQLRYISNAEDRYNLYSYSYTSSNSKFARDHWDEYAATIKARFPDQDFVVEIGSNDGYLVHQFKSDTTQVLGIDSSGAMCGLAVERGVDCIHSVFDRTVGEAAEITNGPASLIIANNVFNHANDPVNFAQGVAALLAPGGRFVFELPYWLSTIERGTLPDQVYHEHVSYFTVKSAWNLLQAAGLEIEDVDLVNYHGGSIRVIARHATGAGMPIVVEDYIARETQIGLFSANFYHNLQQQFEQQRDAWLYNFYQIRLAEPDAVFIGVGAAAKANTWLTWHGLTASHLYCVTDASEHKQGKYTPLTRIPVRGDQEFAQHEKPYALILSWNISEPLKQALININPNIRFLSQ